jgi:CRISPR/Cas system-associated protein Csx1
LGSQVGTCGITGDLFSDSYNNSLTVTESSFQNTAATSAALAAQKQSIPQLRADTRRSKCKLKELSKSTVDNRTKWRADIAKNKATYDAELARIKKWTASKSKTALTSAALKNTPHSKENHSRLQS